MSFPARPVLRISALVLLKRDGLFRLVFSFGRPSVRPSKEQ